MFSHGNSNNETRNSLVEVVAFVTISSLVRSDSLVYQINSVPWDGVC